jgi:hypothetical protein
MSQWRVNLPSIAVAILASPTAVSFAEGEIGETMMEALVELP